MIGLRFIIGFSIVFFRCVLGGNAGYVFEMFPGDNIVAMAVMEGCWFRGCHRNWFSFDPLIIEWVDLVLVAC